MRVADRRSLGVAALFALCLVASVALTACEGTTPHPSPHLTASEHLGTTTTLPADMVSAADVPPQIPSGGVAVGPVGDQFFLMPPTGTPTITAAQALADAQPNQYNVTPQVILADLTDPATIPPPGDTGRSSELKDRLVYMVVGTYPHPENGADFVITAAPAPGTKPTPPRLAVPVVDHSDTAIDAHTGKMIGGWVTR